VAGARTGGDAGRATNVGADGDAETGAGAGAGRVGVDSTGGTKATEAGSLTGAGLASAIGAHTRTPISASMAR
jgi:hypothetical protein